MALDSTAAALVLPPVEVQRAMSQCDMQSSAYTAFMGSMAMLPEALAIYLGYRKIRPLG